MKISERYETTGGVSTGGMGEIIECIDLHLQRPVVVKQLQTGMEERRIIDELKALIKLRSKHVVQLFDIIEISNRTKNETAIVLEYIDGKNLQVKSFSADRDFLKVLWQISCGLADIHGAGIIHRDIKPDNIRIDSEGIVKIIDFGLARTKDDAKTKSVIGTPIFMAPELWSGSTITFGPEIDVYAFGATALALVGEPPPRPLILQPPQPVSFSELSSCLPGLQIDVAEMIHQCLSANPKHRPRMVEIRDILARSLLENEHRALVVMGGTPHFLDAQNRKISLTAAGVGALEIEYDGFDFKIVAASGSVAINNSVAIIGKIIPGCCVIAFGTGVSRRFVTFDVSSPEVMP